MDRLDVKLWALAEKGQIVPDRSLLKTPEQIAEIRRALTSTQQYWIMWLHISKLV